MPFTGRSEEHDVDQAVDDPEERTEEVPVPLFTQTVGLLLEATATRAPKRTPDSNEGSRKGPRH